MEAEGKGDSRAGGLCSEPAVPRVGGQMRASAAEAGEGPGKSSQFRPVSRSLNLLNSVLWEEAIAAPVTGSGCR